MSREQIIQMAREAEHMRINEYYTNGTVSAFSDDQLERFAKLVAEHEREACAKVCEEIGQHNIINRCADAIRARGQA